MSGVANPFRSEDFLIHDPDDLRRTLNFTRYCKTLQKNTRRPHMRNRDRPWPVEQIPMIPHDEYKWERPAPKFYRITDRWSGSYIYAYQTLKSPSSFRLLKLDRNLNCAEHGYHYSLIETTLKEAPPYETLSYVWGTPERDIKIALMDGSLVSITNHLLVALPQIERQCKTGYLWIDQICIDQSDKDERAQQVQIMGDIYSSCSRVIVWLGFFIESHEDSERQSKSEMIAHTTFFHNENLSYLLQSEWFQRAWVFQEIVLPENAILMMESRDSDKMLTMPLHMLKDMIEKEFGKDIIDNASANVVMAMYDRWTERHPLDLSNHASIEMILSRLSPQSRTTHTIDRLYAFLGLNIDPLIKFYPSYTVTVEEALTSTAASIINGTRSLDILELIPRISQDTPSSKSKLASWAPDFRKECLVQPFLKSFYDFRNASTSISKYYAEAVQDTHRSSLYVYGYQVDTLHTKIGTLASDAIMYQHTVSLLTQCQKAWDRIERRHEKESVNEDSADGERVLLATDFVARPTLQRLFSALIAESASLEAFSLAESFDLADALQSHRSTILQTIQGRSLWITQSGRFALGSNLRRNDSIMVLYGASNPVALRQLDTVNSYYTLGSCFLEGWMDPWKSGKYWAHESSFGTGRYIA